MDDEKKLTSENEFENDEFANEQANPSADESKKSEDEFDEFNFTDDFPDEFSEEFMKRPNDAYENNQNDTDFNDDFMASPDETKNASELDQPYNPDADFDDDFMTSPTKEAHKADEFEEPFNPDEDFDDFFSKQEKNAADDAAKTDTDIDDLDLNLDSGAVLPPPLERKGNFFKRHPWLTLIIFLGLIYAGYKLLQGGGTTEIQPLETAQMTPAKQAMPTTGGAEMQQIAERLNTIEQGMNVLNDQLTQLQGAHVRLDQMEQMISKIAEEESTLQETLTRLEALDKQVTELNTLNQRLNALEAHVSVIADEVKLRVTVSDQTQRAANLSRQAMQAKSMIPVPMFVQAAIPGRAWLLSESGELISVARGDDVPGYGRVMNIDPVAGTVTMSSETVFREEE